MWWTFSSSLACTMQNNYAFSHVTTSPWICPISWIQGIIFRFFVWSRTHTLFFRDSYCPFNSSCSPSVISEVKVRFCSSAFLTYVILLAERGVICSSEYCYFICIFAGTKQAQPCLSSIRLVTTICMVDLSMIQIVVTNRIEEKQAQPKYK